VRIGNLPICGKQLYDHIVSLRGEA